MKYMKTIAIIVDSHVGSTIPLCKALAKKGYKVDYYIIGVGTVRSPEGTDIEFCTSKIGVSIIPPSNYPKLNAYFSNSDVTLYSITLPRLFSKFRLVSRFMSLLRKIIMKSCAKKICQKSYAWINLVGRHNSVDLIPFLDICGNKCVLSLHEVFNHANPDFSKVPELISKLIDKRIDTVVHSIKSLKDILCYDGIDESYIHHINFGLFESFSIYNADNTLPLPNRYFLFFGRITPYKGLSLFVEAAKTISRKYPKIKYVIAGSGKDPVLYTLKNDDRFVILNRFITNEELAKLIRSSHAIVCPYTTMSQSGIPQTAYVFNKPIIASNLDGFREVISNKVNGLLFEVNSIEQLSKAMEDSLNPDIYTKLVNGVSDFQNQYPAYSWSCIAEQYINLK